MSFQACSYFRRNYKALKQIEIFGIHACKNEYASCHSILCIRITDLLLTAATKQTLVNNKPFVDIALEQQGRKIFHPNNSLSILSHYMQILRLSFRCGC